jgi:hypothetical protein
MPGESKTPEVELEGLISTAKQLAAQVRAAIQSARNARHEALELESRSNKAAATEVRAEAENARETAGSLLGELIDLKRRIEICSLRSDDRTRPVRETLEKLSFITTLPGSNLWPPASSLDEEGVLKALDSFERLIDMITIPDRLGATGNDLAGTLKNGQFCDRVADEIRKIRHMYPAHTMAQIRSEHPNFLVWSVIDHADTDAEDRDTFHHPTRWGPVVGYAIKLLARHFGKSEETIKRWRKEYRKYARSAGARN